MTGDSTLDGTSVTERLVLHELAELERQGRTPAEALDVLSKCRERLVGLDEIAGGRLTEADLVRSCRRLDDEGLVTEIEGDDTSPVGKGRPSYELDVDAAAVRELVRDDDRFEGLPADGEVA